MTSKQNRLPVSRSRGWTVQMSRLITRSVSSPGAPRPAECVVQLAILELEPEALPASGRLLLRHLSAESPGELTAEPSRFLEEVALAVRRPGGTG
eukprot:scaffold216212_cov32-Tisochrysis_lutea.AAC.4